MKLSKSARVLIASSKAGYKVVDGKVISPSGEVRKTSIFKSVDTPYERFSVSLQDVGRATVFVHRLVAFQEYGKSIFDPEIEVRHKDNNSLNNMPDNIILGTRSDNMMDKSVEVRRNSAKVASEVGAKKLRRFTDEDVGQIRDDRAAGMTYRELMNKWNIPAKSSVNNILNRKYKTTK